MAKDLYGALGVDSDKTAVREIFAGGVHNHFPGAFINIVRSILFPGYVKTQHSDGDGSKIILRILMYLLTGNPRWFYGFIDDAWSMNFGDVACGGFVEGEYMVTNTVNQNAFNVPKEVILEAVRERAAQLIDLYGRHGFAQGLNTVYFLGGETADLPRQVQSAVFDITVSACMREEGVIAGNSQAGDLIWGFASGGQAKWEPQPISPIMSNGLTLGIDCLIHPCYLEQFPKLLIAGETFKGKHMVDDPSGLEGMTIAEALLSPTRQFAIPIKMLIDRLKADNALPLLHGLSLDTGGGATKPKHLGQGGIIYHKKMPPPGPLFRLIQAESGQSWKNMHRTFNCEVGVDIVGRPELGPYLEAVQEESGIILFRLGECFKYAGPENRVLLETEFGEFSY